MSCLISFERCQSSCEERGTSEHYKKFLCTVGFEHQHCTSCFPACPSSHSSTGTVDDMRWELLQYLFTLLYYKTSVPCAKGYAENENEIIANLQFGDWYHLKTRWLTQKKKFIMSYVSMTIYNIYSFLFIIVYIVCIIICFLILYLCEVNFIWFDKIPVSTIKLPQWRFQAFLDVFLFEKLIWKSRRPQDKTSIRGASPGLNIDARKCQNKVMPKGMVLFTNKITISIHL